MTMAGRCPHLGLTGKREQVYSVVSTRHRCYLGGQPERIGSAHQASACLTTAFRRCPRLLSKAASVDQPIASRQHGFSGPPSAQHEPTFKRTLAVARSTFLLDPLSQAKPQFPYTELRVAPARKKARPGRAWTMTERMVLCLGVAILMACAFIGSLIAYRLRVGPGMVSGPRESGGIVQDPVLTPMAPPTLVPTFTPTPVPTLPAPTAATVTGPPTTIPEPTLLMPTPVTRLPANGPPTRLVIPKVGIDIPVLPVGVKTMKKGGTSKKVWADVPNAGGFHQTSAYPGYPGNTVINGHRDILGSVFRNLDRVAAGDEIILYVDETAYPYTVTETRVVPEAFASDEQRAENQRLISYMPEERLTLITCTPVGLATHRLLVIAKPPEQAGPQMPQAGSDAQP